MNRKEKLTQQKLEEIKLKLMLIATDYDETLRSRVYTDFNDDRAIDLIKKILTHHALLIITARGATIIKILLPHFGRNAKQVPRHRFFLGTGNGRILYEVINKHLKEIYNHGLTALDVKSILEVYEEVFDGLKIKKKELLPKGLKTYQSIILQLRNDRIPRQIFKQCFKYNGGVFTEEAKVGLVQIKDQTRNNKLISHLSHSLDKKHPNKFQVIRGDIDIHIVKQLPEDGKVTATKKVIDLLAVKLGQVAVFGDLPNGNDKEILTSFPFSFTNAIDFYREKTEPTSSPFLLPGALESPIGSVHKAIHFLLNDT
ncbi:MAG TPA: hypothetical protein VJH96_03510 [Patescibacteria group bacterium]|nr:hypothetical protein [Patescibacteria group bacterium]